MSSDLGVSHGGFGLLQLQTRSGAGFHQGAQPGHFGLTAHYFGIDVVLCAGKTGGQEKQEGRIKTHVYSSYCNGIEVEGRNAGC
jgi:hypothetical protein